VGPVGPGALAKNELAALKSYQKATGGNHFEHSEVHVLQQNHLNLALAIIQYHFRLSGVL